MLSLLYIFNRNNEAQQILGAWNMQFEGNLLKLNGRSLPIESMFTKTEKVSIILFNGAYGRKLQLTMEHLSN